MNKNIYNPNSDIYLDYGYLMFPISLSITTKIIVGTKTFYSKTGYHVSLMRLEDLAVVDRQKVFNFARKYLIRLKKITDTFRLATEGDRQSIIVRVSLYGLRQMISAINHHFGYSFKVPPAHITLFTLKDQYGIGINSLTEYRQLTHQISQEDSRRLAKSFELIL